jgi:hypothetical protein
VAMHTCPCIHLVVGGETAVFKNRTIGMHTGSRSAASAGRIPPVDVAALRMNSWLQQGLDVDTCRFGLASFVDNLFTIARSPEAATGILDDCQNVLLQRWGLNIGADSKEYMTCRGYSCAVAVHSSLDPKECYEDFGASP